MHIQCLYIHKLKKAGLYMYTHRHCYEHTLTMCMFNNKKFSLEVCILSSWNLNEYKRWNGKCKAAGHTGRIILSVARFISSPEVHSFLLSCFYFLAYLSQHVLSVYTSVSNDVSKTKLSVPMEAIEYSFDVGAFYSIISWIGSVVLYFAGVFERKPSIKRAFFSTCSISFHQLFWGVSVSPLVGQNA